MTASRPRCGFSYPFNILSFHHFKLSRLQISVFQTFKTSNFRFKSAKMICESLWVILWENSGTLLKVWESPLTNGRKCVKLKVSQKWLGCCYFQPLSSSRREVATSRSRCDFSFVRKVNSDVKSGIRNILNTAGGVYSLGKADSQFLYLIVVIGELRRRRFRLWPMLPPVGSDTV